MNIIVDDQPAREFAPLLSLAKLAISRQHRTVTTQQFVRLERSYRSSRPKPTAGLVMARFCQHRRELKSELEAHGVTVRPENPGRVHAFKLVSSGFPRLSEIEKKIKKSRRRRAA